MIRQLDGPETSLSGWISAHRRPLVSSLRENGSGGIVAPGETRHSRNQRCRNLLSCYIIQTCSFGPSRRRISDDQQNKIIEESSKLGGTESERDASNHMEQNESRKESPIDSPPLEMDHVGRGVWPALKGATKPGVGELQLPNTRSCTRMQPQ